MARSAKPTAKPSQLRIIGGHWRSRKLRFVPAPGLRPTTDRIRETLFNWLEPFIVDARCADLFAGSGALGLEALSRGADHCDFVDSGRGAVTQIQQHLDTLDARHRGACHQMNAADFLSSANEPWDIVFIDPPFGLDLVNPTCQLLAQHKLLRDGAMIYIETASDEHPPVLDAGCRLHREKTAGDVIYRLYVKES